MVRASATIGRASERGAIDRWVAAGDSVIVAGSSGVGKTHLVRDVVTRLAVDGVATGWVTATGSSREIPLGALRTLLPGELMTSASAANATDVLSWLRGRGARGERVLPEVIAVDDAHLLDPASAMVMHQWVAARDAQLLMTVTSGQEPPDAVRALWKDELAQRIDLAPLSRDETDAMVVELLGGPAGALLLERVWSSTRGSPLYVRELVRAAEAGGWLTRSVHWELDEAAAQPGPLVDLISTRIEQLSASARRVAEVVALAAPMPMAIVERLCPSDAIAEAEEKGLVEVVELSGRVIVRSTHPMHDEVTRTLLPGARRRALCRELADAIEATNLRRRDDLLRFLIWRLDSGQGARTDQLLQGAWQAADAHDQRLAERLSRAALTDSGDHRARLALADALYRQARHADTIEVLSGDASDRDEERTEIVIARAKALWGLGRVDDAEAELVAVASGVSDTNCAASLQGFRGTLRAALGHPAEAIALSQPIVADTTIAERARLTAIGSLALGLAFSGRSAEAREAVRLGTDPALLARVESRTGLSWVEPPLFAASWLSGDVPTMHRIAAAYRQIGLDTGDRERVAAGTMGMGWAALHRGDVDTAVRLLDESAALAPVHDRIGIRAVALIGLGWAHAWRNDPSAASAALDRADVAAHAGTRWFEPCGVIGRAWVAATLGDQRAAIQLLENLAADTARVGFVPYAIAALHAMARIGRPSSGGRIAQLASHTDGVYAPVAVAHVHALADKDPVALVQCGDDFERLEMVLLAAESAAAAVVAFEAEGEFAKAEAARASCDERLARCPGAWPVTLATLQRPSLLTSREHEVARLAADGHATKEIAERLFVSTRTVESHLAHAYAKLGVAGRQELTAALGLHAGRAADDQVAASRTRASSARPALSPEP